MEYKKNIFLKKKILIYGLGETGLSSYNFLRKNNDLYLYDDNKNLIKNKIKKKLLVKRKNIYENKFDFILLSPGINFKKCHLKNFLKKNFSKIVTDLDVFYGHYFHNKNIGYKFGGSALLRFCFKLYHPIARWRFENQIFAFFIEDHLKDGLLYVKYLIRKLLSGRKGLSFDYFQKSLNASEV